MLELEYKFSLSGDPPDPADLEAELAALLGAAGYDVEARPPREQHDRYVDTANGALAGAGLALRLRTVGGETLVTLKSEATVTGGRHRREELEWPLAGPWPDALRAHLREVADPDILADTLAPVADLYTERRPFVVSRAGAALAELAFDDVRAERPGGRGSVHFREVELESLGADPATLEDLAQLLRDGLPLFDNPVNKLERARALLLMAEALGGG